MINLKGQQIQALAEKISKEINVEITKTNEANKNIVFKSFYKTKEGKALLLLRQSYPNSSYFTEGTVYSAIIPNNLKKSQQSFVSQQTIANDIIIETIECDNLELLIKNIKTKYTK